MKEQKDIRVHQIWLGLQAWEKILAVFVPIAIGLASGVGGSAFTIGMFKQRIEMSLVKHDDDITTMKNKIDEVQVDLRSKVGYNEFYEVKKKADESRESLIELKADVSHIRSNTERTLNEVEKIRDRR